MKMKFMKRVFLLILTGYILVCVLTATTATAQEVQNNDNEKVETETEKPDVDNQPKDNSAENSYTKLLKKKRIAQQTAVKKILDLGDFKKQKDMVDILSKKLFQVLATSLDKLVKAQNNLKDSKIDKEMANDLSMVIENTAFAADLSLHFPKILHRIYDKNDNWQKILESSIDLTKKSRLADEETLRAIDLMSQELNIIPRDPNFFNPFSNTDKQHRVAEPEAPKEIKKKREKRRRGPGLSGGRLGEL